MKIECVKDKLLEAVQKVEKMTGKNLSLPALSCISIEADQTKTILRATNLDIGIEFSLPAKTYEIGNLTLSGQTLLQFLANIPQSEKVTIESSEGVAKITTNHATARIKTIPSEDFPIIPKISDGSSFEIPPEELITGLKSVWYSSAVTSMKPELSSVYIYQDEDNLVFVATDSFRLAEKRVKTKKIKDFGSILIPYKNVVEIIKVLEGEKENIKLNINSNQIAFSWNGIYLVSRIINGAFPDYKQIIPKDPKTEVVILKQDLIQGLKLANVFTDNFHQVVLDISPKNKEFEVTTKNNALGDNKTQLEAVLKGEEITISFNYKYIIDCFQSIAADSVSLNFHGLGRPLVVKGVSDSSFTYLVMPMNR